MMAPGARTTTAIRSNSKRRDLRVDVSDSRDRVANRMAKPTQPPTLKLSMLHKARRLRTRCTTSQAISTIQADRVHKAITTLIQANSIRLELKLRSNSNTQARAFLPHRWVMLEPTERASISHR